MTILTYASPPQPGTTRHRRIWWDFLGLPAFFVPFLVFTWNVSPFDAASDGVKAIRELHYGDILLGFMGMPFFLATIWVVYPLFKRFGLTTYWVRILAWTIAALGWAIFLTMLGVGWIQMWQEFKQYGLKWGQTDNWGFFSATLLAIIGLIFTIRRRNLSLALATPFIANASLCLFCFWNDAKLGYWVTAYLCAIIIPDCVRQSRQPN